MNAWIAASEATYNYVLDTITEETFITRKRAEVRRWDERYEAIYRENFRRAEALGQRDMLRNMPDDETDLQRYMAVQERYIQPFLASVTVPAMLIWAADDATVPVERGVELMRALPNADLHVLRHAGHMVMHDRSDAFDPLVRDCAGMLADTRIDEHDQMRVSDTVDHLWHQLIGGLRLDIGSIQSALHGVSEVLTNRVVTAERVAVADNQDHRLISCTISPPGASS